MSDGMNDILIGVSLREKTKQSFNPKGNISAASGFPTEAEVQNGWLYSAAADVTDNDATKTNTGQSFVEGQEFYWYDTGWVIMGDDRLWGDDGTSLSPVATRKINIPTGQTYDVNGSPHTHAHNDTTEKQGGTTDEYYHLTEDEYASLINSQGKETADRTIYLSPTGSDTTGEGTEANPYFSIHKALSDIRLFCLVSSGSNFTPQITIQAASGTYDYSALDSLDFGRFLSGVSVRILIRGLDGSVINAFSSAETGTIDNGGTTEHGSVHLNTGKAWTPNAYVGKFMYQTSTWTSTPTTGDANKTSPIWSNTADTLKTAFGSLTAKINPRNYSIVEHLVVFDFGLKAIIVPDNLSLSWLAVAVKAKEIRSSIYSARYPHLANFTFSTSLCYFEADEIQHYQRWSVNSTYFKIKTNSSSIYLTGILTNCVFTTAKSSSSAGAYMFAHRLSFAHSVFEQSGASKYFMTSAGYGINLIWSGPNRLVGHLGLMNTGHSNVSSRERNLIYLCRYDTARPAAWYADAARAIVYLYNQSLLSIIGDKNSQTMLVVNEPSIGRLTIDNVVDAPTYFDPLMELNAVAIAPDGKNTTSFQQKVNSDVDTGTEVVDSFADTACKAVRWDFMVSNSDGTAVRCGSINAVWDAAVDTINDSDEYGVVEVGDTTDLTFTVTIAANLVTLSAVAASNNWIVKVQRYPIG